MENVKISKRKMFESLANLATTGELYFKVEDGRVVVSAEELLEFAQAEIAAIDNKNEKARTRAAAKREAGNELSETIYNTLTDEPMLLADIVEAIGDPDLSVAKVTYWVNQLVKADRVAKSTVSVPSVEGGKARNLTAYAKI